MKSKKQLSYIFRILAVIIVAALAYSINLVNEQQRVLNISIDALDRIILNVDKLRVERLRLEIENAELRKLEKATTEDMKENE